MVARLLLKLPWFLAAPSLVLMAAVMAVGLNIVAGTYFERSYRDDLDPLAGLAQAVPASTAPAATVATPAATASSGTPAVVNAAGSSTPAPVIAVPAAGTATSSPAGASSPPDAAPAAPASGPAVLAEGSFRDGDPGHNGKGRARLIRGADGALTLRFEGFSVTNGPDLYVVLTTDAEGGRDAARAGDALNLGRLRATNGNINYPVPAETDTSRFKSVVVYCRAFHVVFAVATFE